MENLCHFKLEKPPEFLFYATNAYLSDKVFRQGLKPQNSPFVEVYDSIDKAKRTIDRKAQKATFVIIARTMADDGYRFCHAETGEWLVDEIPSRYILLQ